MLIFLVIDRQMFSGSRDPGMQWDSVQYGYFQHLRHKDQANNFNFSAYFSTPLHYGCATKNKKIQSSDSQTVLLFFGVCCCCCHCCFVLLVFFGFFLFLFICFFKDGQQTEMNKPAALGQSQTLSELNTGQIPVVHRLSPSELSLCWQLFSHQTLMPCSAVRGRMLRQTGDCHATITGTCAAQFLGQGCLRNTP